MKSRRFIAPPRFSGGILYEPAPDGWLNMPRDRNKCRLRGQHSQGQKAKFRSDRRMSALRPQKRTSRIYADTPLEHVGQRLPVQVDIQALHAEIADFTAHRFQA